MLTNYIINNINCQQRNEEKKEKNAATTGIRRGIPPYLRAGTESIMPDPHNALNGGDISPGFASDVLNPGHVFFHEVLGKIILKHLVVTFLHIR